MPVEVTERALRDALALAGEWDLDGTPAAQAALEWMGWEGEGPLWLHRYDVQLFINPRAASVARTRVRRVAQRRRAESLPSR